MRAIEADRMTADPYGRWDALMNPPAPRLIPPPELPAHPVADGCPIPDAAARFAARAAEYGWMVLTTHARGPVVHATHGTVTRVVDSIAVRITRGHQRAYACWVDGKFNNPATSLDPGEHPVLHGAEDIKAHISTPRGPDHA
jgi:hypothetical protein